MGKTQLINDLLVLFGGLNFAASYSFDSIDKHVTLSLACFTFLIYLILNLRRLIIEGEALIKTYIIKPIKTLINLFKTKK